MTQKGPAPGRFIISVMELTPSLASGQTLLRRAPSHLPGSTTADARRSPWESHPHRLGKPAARQLSPQPGPLLCVSREGKESKETCFGSLWCGFKSRPQHSLDVFSGASYFIFLTFKMRVSVHIQGTQIPQTLLSLCTTLNLGSSLRHAAHWGKEAQC